MLKMMNERESCVRHSFVSTFLTRRGHVLVTKPVFLSSLFLSLYDQFFDTTMRVFFERLESRFGRHKLSKSAVVMQCIRQGTGTQLGI